MSREALLQIYYYMRLTRAMEDRTRTLFLLHFPHVLCVSGVDLT